jgi:hypothetical protein
MDINIFLLCYNESVLLPHTVSHYKKYLPNCKITIYDNESTDNSVEIAKNLGCSVFSYSSNNIIDDGLYVKLKNSVWKGCNSGWVIMADMDEFLCVTEDELMKEMELGTTMLRIIGYDMIGESETIDLTDIDLQKINKYIVNHNESKNLCLLREAIIDMNYDVGAHICNPTGNVVYSYNVYINKHMSKLGLNFLINKLTKRYERSEKMRSYGLCRHYTNDIDKIKEDYKKSIDIVMNSIDIVISRYNENLEWLIEINEGYFNIIVYNKGVNDNFIKLPNMTIIKLDNVGRCDHTYLYHVINNYHNLANITVFLPGSGNMEFKLTKIKKLTILIKKYNSAVFLPDVVLDSVKDNQYNFTLSDWMSSDIQNRELNPESNTELSKIRPFGKWYEYYFNDITIHGISYWGIFSIDKRDILQHSKEYYENLIKQLCNSSNPEAGHYFERSWSAVFYPMNNTLKSLANINTLNPPANINNAIRSRANINNAIRSRSNININIHTKMHTKMHNMRVVALQSRR